MIDSPVLSVRIPPQWRHLVGGHEEVTASGDSVASVLEAVGREYPSTRDKLFSPDGRLQGGFMVFLGARNIRDLAGLETPVGLEEVVTIILEPAG